MSQHYDDQEKKELRPIMDEETKRRLWAAVKEKSPTPDHVLETQIRDPRIPKDEVVHYAARRIDELEAEAKGGDIMAAKDAERIAELGGALGEMTTRRNLAENEVRRLQAENERLRPDAERYRDLLYQVQRKFPDESRHETALRYIKNAEKQDNAPEDAAREGE